MAKFRDADGRIVMRSTKQTDRHKARKVAEAWEEAARIARAGELTQSASIKILSELMEKTIGERLEIQTVEGFLREWLSERANIGESTVKRYRPVVDGFIAFLPAVRRKASIGSVTSSEVERYQRQQIEEGKGPSTANFAVKVLRAALNRARRKGLALSNPAEAVDMIPGESEKREPFTDKELAALVREADGEWRGMVLIGVHTGMRLGDIANLTWDNIDLSRRVVTHVPDKQRAGRIKMETIALHDDVVHYLSGRGSNIEEAPIFPGLKGKVSGGGQGLSDAFSALMRRAEVGSALGLEKKGKGRRFRAKTFHSLRHTFVSRLANAEVSPDVRKAMVGHSSDEVHDRYVHMDLSAQERALEKLTSVL